MLSAIPRSSSEGLEECNGEEDEFKDFVRNRDQEGKRKTLILRVWG